MGLLNQSAQNYYGNESQHYGNQSYQFTSLDDVINNFMVSYVGEDKIISKIKKSDIQFHAMRSMQELSFDTFRSIKSQESVVPPSLKLMLPQDYVNYTNISWVDSSGIQHTIHPTSKTSNPQSRGNLVGNSTIEESAAGFDLGSGFTFSDTVNNNGGIIVSGVPGDKLKIPVNVSNGAKYRFRFSVNREKLAVGMTGSIIFKLYTKGFQETFSSGPIDLALQVGITNTIEYVFNLTEQNASFQATTDTDEQVLVIQVLQPVADAFLDNFVLLEESGPFSRKTDSTSWSNYKSSGNDSNVDNNYSQEYIDNNNLILGQRYGLDPQYAQSNGTFFIEDNILYFGSSLNGKTIVIKYISDGLADEKDMVVHKFAEEAMYKCIAYAVMSTRINTPEYVIQRFRKEKFAATRKAKLRLSNLKLEELTQTLRGKSKIIKH